MEDITGINESQLQKTIDELNVRLTTISKIFDQMERVINESSSYVKEEVGESLRNNFRTLSGNFSTVLDNINTYIVELSTCKGNYKRQDLNASILFQDRLK